MRTTGKPFLAAAWFAAWCCVPPVHAAETDPEPDPTVLVIRNKVGRHEPVFTDALFLERLAERRDWTRVETENTPHLTEAVLAPLAGLPALRVLKLSTSAITDTGLELLARSPVLTTLDITPFGGGLAVTSAGLAALGRSPALEDLALRVKHLDDAGLAGLAEAPALRRLTLLNPNNAVLVNFGNRPCRPFIRDGVSRVTRAGLEALTRSPTLTHLRLEGARLTDDDAAVVARIPKLESLDWVFVQGHPADNGRFGDDFFRALAEAPRLRELRLSAFLLQAGPDGVAALAERGRLTRLSLDLLRLAPDRQDALLAVVARFPRLETLELAAASPRFTDEGFRRLAGLTALKTFSLSSTSLTDDALSTMDGWNKLASLRFDASQLSDVLLIWAAGRPALRELANTCSHRFTDAGLEALGPECGLRLLRIGGRFTPEGVDALKARLPRLEMPLSRSNVRKPPPEARPEDGPE